MSALSPICVYTYALMTKRSIFLTSALPYANGAIHLGHLVEYIQTDIWARFQRMSGHELVYICADDTHGTPIMLRAEKEGISSEALIDRVWTEHFRDFTGFGVKFDHYYTTHSNENRELAEGIYKALRAQGLIEIRQIDQMYDPVKNMFLPDRFIKGGCPRCGAADQYGDSCEACGATYSPTDLKNPISAVSGAKPETRQSEHHFFKLSDPRCVQFLRQWALQDNRLQPEAANKLREWLGSGDDPDESELGDWDISRDAPYFGFEIPDAPGKYFYVWLDAPIGYYAGLKNWCEKNGRDFNAFTAQNSSAEQIHFIGKDILYFHTLFWPAMLQFGGFRPPSRVYAHGFLTVDGAKMSKSRGTFITAESYLNRGLNPEWLRYYFACKLNGSLEDLDLNFNDFIARVNSDLVGKFANIASRTAGFVRKLFDGQLLEDARDEGAKLTNSSLDDHQALEASFIARAAAIAEAYEARDTARATREIGQLMDAVNAYVDQHKPWELAKSEEPSDRPKLHRICSTSLRCFARLCILLQPMLPTVGQRARAEVFGLPPAQENQAWLWSELDRPPVKHVGTFGHLLSRVERSQIDSLIHANIQS
jgi:methionyl-tRNA synthetase